MNVVLAGLVIFSTLFSVTMWAITFRATQQVNTFLVEQFTTDSGTSLRDAVDRLEAGVARMEEAAQVIAENLVVSTGKIEAVADDLEKSQARADKVTEGSPGEAADAGAQGPREHHVGDEGPDLPPYDPEEHP